MAETAAAGGGRGVEKLERFLRLQFKTLAGSTGSSWLNPDFSALPDPQKADIRKKSRAVDAMVQQFIAEGVADGSIVATEPKIAEFFLIGALNWLPRCSRRKAASQATSLPRSSSGSCWTGCAPRSDKAARDGPVVIRDFRRWPADPHIVIDAIKEARAEVARTARDPAGP